MIILLAMTWERLIQLIQDVLNLSLELVVGVLHKIGQHLIHAKVKSKLLQALPRQDRVQGSIDMSSDLEILTFNKFIENFEYSWNLLALVLSVDSQTQVHEQSSGILQSVVAQLIKLISDSLNYPLYHIELDH